MHTTPMGMKTTVTIRKTSITIGLVKTGLHAPSSCCVIFVSASDAGMRPCYKSHQVGPGLQGGFFDVGFSSSDLEQNPKHPPERAFSSLSPIEKSTLCGRLGGIRISHTITGHTKMFWIRGQNGCGLDPYQTNHALDTRWTCCIWDISKVLYDCGIPKVR